MNKIIIRKTILHNNRGINFPTILVLLIDALIFFDRAEVSDVYSDEKFVFHLWTDYVKTLIKIGLSSDLRF